MKVHGNDVSSSDEEIMSAFLMERNLKKSNDFAEIVHPKVNFYSKYGKRIIDIIVSLFAIIVLSPLFIVLVFLNLLNLGSPILYKQTRVGYKDKEFDIYKFRSMKNATGKDGRQLPASQRLTKYGRIIRKISFDELPNFINILKGDMSIIGPRPLLISFHERMNNRHRQRTLVRPGLECPRMIALKEEDTDYYEVQFENDIWYLENISFLTDVRMILALVKMVLGNKERSKHANVGTFFVGYTDDNMAICLRAAKERYPDICR